MTIIGMSVSTDDGRGEDFQTGVMMVIYWTILGRNNYFRPSHEG